MNVEFHPEAIVEFSQAVEFYEDRQPRVGVRFRDRVREIVASLNDRSDTGWQHHAGTRLQRVTNFPYGVIFLVREDRIQILAVAHSSRRADYWLGRLPTNRDLEQGKTPPP